MWYPLRCCVSLRSQALEEDLANATLRKGEMKMPIMSVSLGRILAYLAEGALLGASVYLASCGINNPSDTSKK